MADIHIAMANTLKNSDIYPIFIPSKNREDGKTFNLLKDIDCNKYIVVEPQDFEKYQKYSDNFEIIKIDKNNQGLPYARNFLKQCAEKKYDWFWQIDDDISQFFETKNNKNVKISPETALDKAQDLFKVLPVALGSLEYQQFAWSQKKEFKLNSYADCVVCFNTKRTRKYKYDNKQHLKQDRDLVLQILNDKQFTMRTCRISFGAPTMGTNKGGLQSIYRENKEKEAVESLIKKWGSNLIKIQVKDQKQGKRYDAKINWKHFKVNFNI